MKRESPNNVTAHDGINDIIFSISPHCLILNKEDRSLLIPETPHSKMCEITSKSESGENGCEASFAFGLFFFFIILYF